MYLCWPDSNLETFKDIVLDSLLIVFPSSPTMSQLIFGQSGVGVGVGLGVGVGSTKTQGIGFGK